MASSLDYKAKKNKELDEKVVELLKTLPDFMTDFYYGNLNHLAPQSMFNYVTKLDYFFRFLHEHNPYFQKKEISKITLSDIELLTVDDLDEFLQILNHNSDIRFRSGKKNTVETYASTLSTFYKFFVKREKLSKDVTVLLERGKPKKIKPIYLTDDEKEIMKNEIISGEHLTTKQQIAHEKNMERDLAIYQLFVTTGIRISELVGLNTNDVYDSLHYIGIIRKGGNYQEVYYPDTTGIILNDYMEIRKERYHCSDSEKALFLNRDGKRISVRMVEKIIKKYAKSCLGSKATTLSPHKLRATFAVKSLEKSGGNLRLVQTQLGHSSVTTTQLYTDISKDALKNNRNNVE